MTIDNLIGIDLLQSSFLEGREFEAEGDQEGALQPQPGVRGAPSASKGPLKLSPQAVL